MKVKIRERSFFARLAALKLQCSAVAMVVGDTIHLWNVNREEFLRHTPWVLHEMEHVRQYHQYGFLRFLLLYLWESAQRGYYNNRFEVEARQAEKSSRSLEGIEFL